MLTDYHTTKLLVRERHSELRRAGHHPGRRPAGAPTDERRWWR
jgi:hypothetical protein